MTERLALFPLSTVLYPGLVLPLHVFEERYRALVGDLLQVPEDAPRRFGVVTLRAGREVAPSGPDGPLAKGAAAGLGPDPMESLHPVGCVAEVATIQNVDDDHGGYNLVVTGTRRFELKDLDASGAYLVGEVEYLADSEGDDAAVLAGGVAEAFRTYQQRLAGVRQLSLAALQEIPSEPAVLSYLVATATVLDLAEKQRLLAESDAAERLRQELALLRRETALLAALPSLPAVDLAREEVYPN
ncbi:LON peptidase substrate-binding domain-containing protein [Allostreptomyces psammosilenae]|uniref:Lon N-terminal domain-containing protein n=1 Tax=Allostreptomyces psammosilenae TaxID=1892865 RepID=A0A853A9D7_9ACTN|nr:LON peptidase substrate-binding domain-containing protein [Allostreptomyces psammosilenae]NYI07128.1 hypothetical protein [Allostreptomyces psammosilenae]